MKFYVKYIQIIFTFMYIIDKIGEVKIRKWNFFEKVSLCSFKYTPTIRYEKHYRFFIFSLEFYIFILHLLLKYSKFPCEVSSPLLDFPRK